MVNKHYREASLTHSHCYRGNWGSPHLQSPGGGWGSLNKSATHPAPLLPFLPNKTEQNKMQESFGRTLIETPFSLPLWCSEAGLLAKDGPQPPQPAPHPPRLLAHSPLPSRRFTGTRGSEWSSWSSAERSIIILKKKREGERDGYVREGGRDLRPIIFLQNTLCDNSGSPQRAACSNRA